MKAGEGCFLFLKVSKRPLTEYVIPHLHVNGKNPANSGHYRGPSVTDARSPPGRAMRYGLLATERRC